jgi:hypothetical protein
LVVSMHNWKMFIPVWAMFFAFCLSGPFLSAPGVYEKHPGIAWPVFFATIGILGVGMTFLRRVMLRILVDKSMSATTRGALFVMPSMLMGILGAILGFWLKRQFSG